MDVLSDILSHLKLAGTLYFRTEFTSPWSVRVPSFENVSRFHYAHRGRCLVRIEPDQPAISLEQGDLVIITRGASHTLFCDHSTEDQAVQLDQVIQESGFSGKGALVYGKPGTDHETQLVCGHFAFDDRARHPLIEALPSHIHVRQYGETAGIWMENTLRFIGAEAGQQSIGSEIIALKLSEIVFAQALRAYLLSDGAKRRVMAGFADPKIARTLTAIHEKPAYPWSLTDLAQIAAMSRTSFVTRFAQTMNSTPMTYITQWRMQLASSELLESKRSIIDIAESTGYQSEAAFGRVFKRHFGIPPATYRREQQHSPQGSMNE